VWSPVDLASREEGGIVASGVYPGGVWLAGAGEGFGIGPSAIVGEVGWGGS